MTNPRFMLDTSIVSYVSRPGKPALEKRMQTVAFEDLCVSALTKTELNYGIVRKPEATKIKENIYNFLSRIETMPWDEMAADTYGKLRAALERRGTPIDTMDVLIAAHAVSIGAILITNNKDFRHIEGLKTEDWTLPQT